MGIHYDDCDPRADARSSLGSVSGRAKLAAAEKTYANTGSGPVQVNKRGQLEQSLEALASSVLGGLELAQRIHNCLLGHRDTPEGKSANATIAVGLLAQHNDALQTLREQAMKARHLLEDVASEIGA